MAIRLEGGVHAVAAGAQAAEQAGFESCWVTETNHSAMVLAAAAAQATTRIAIGTGIALAFPRSPTITAMTAWDLDELARGRFILGLGSQVKRINELRFSVPFDHPAPKLKEYTEAIRTVWAANRGLEAVHEGRFYEITMPTFYDVSATGRRDVPIYIAAVGPVMTKVCGEIADGVIAHSLASPEYIRERMRPVVASGLERAGRELGACSVTASPIVAIHDDIDLARREAKLQIAFWGTTRTYRPILALHDREHLTDDLRAAFSDGDQERMVELVDDELCDAIAVTGAITDVRQQLRRWEDVADRVIVGSPRYQMASERLRENREAIMEAFAPVRRSPSSSANPINQAIQQLNLSKDDSEGSQ